MKDQSAVSIIEGLVRGAITITRIEDFRTVLDEYPDNPFVNRLVADFLKRDSSFSNAIKRYQKTFRLFMAEGETLHAIAALLELWEIVKPVPAEFRSLHSQLRRKNSHNSAIDECFAAMSYPELRATLSHLEKIRVKANEFVQQLGDSEESLYFVVSGELVKSTEEDEGKKQGAVKFLIANDHFGDYYPCEVKGVAPYHVRAASDAELLKISKVDFLTICAGHPGLKNGLRKLLKDQLVPAAIKPNQFFRKTSRRHQTIGLSLDIFEPEPGRHPIRVKGYSSDISLGGACILVDPKYRDFLAEELLYRKTMLRVSLPDESISVLIAGNIIWARDTKINGQQTCAIGMQFNETPPRLRAAMIVFVTAVGTMHKQPGDYELAEDEIEAG